jgi:hypothetical protein
MKNIKMILVIILITTMFSGCLSLYYVREKTYDSIEYPFKTKSVAFYKDMLYEISLEQTERTNEKSYSIDIVYSGSSWLFLGSYITIEADSNIIKLKGGSPSRIVLGASSVKETVSASISDKNVEIIANAENVRIQFYGEPKIVSKKGISFFNTFYQETR